ncbi:MAG: C1 family peptidase [Burkholderiales bacterium]|nr:C1 family peptidase [Burkholderiales bacterium]
MPSTSITFQGNKLALDARPDRLDFRDRIFTPRVCNLPPSFPSIEDIKRHFSDYLAADLILDQGADGACTGFGLAAVINYLLWRRTQKIKQTSPRMLYHLAKFYDEWAGEDYEGSSCRGALKGWHKHGVCNRDLWPYTVAADGSVPAFEAPKGHWAEDAVTRPLGVYYRVDKASVTDMQAAILEIGALYVSANLHSGWNLSPRKKGKGTKKTAKLSNLEQIPLIEQQQDMTGGHAFALIGYTDEGFIVQNSWGRDWGFEGFAILTYEDWCSNGSDAWTVSLGVPVSHGALATRNRPNHNHNLEAHARLSSISTAPAYRATGFLLSAAGNMSPKTDGLPRLTTDQAYGLTVVMGNDGGLIQRLVHVENAIATVDEVVLNAPKNWLARQSGLNGKLKLALYAHGGLNSEEDSLKRVAAMAPYFLANGVYPVFITWKTGLGETLIDIIADKVKDALPGKDQDRGWFDALKNAATEVADRTVEAVASTVGGKGQWVQMKQNAEQAALDGDPPRGLFIMAQRLKQLALDLGEDNLEIHLLGHSAGSIVHGHLLELLTARKLKISTCNLFAPACTIDFANKKYRPAIAKRSLAREQFHIHLMSDDRELDDNVAGIYQKSLLYLVARAFEIQHKTPLLGMAASFDAERFANKSSADGQWNQASIATLEDWNQFYWGTTVPSGFAANGIGLTSKQAATLHIINDKTVNCGKRSIPVSHGSFDNDVNVIAQTLTRVLGLNSAEDLPQKIVDLDY